MAATGQAEDWALLEFTDGWQSLSTKDLSFTDVLSQMNSQDGDAGPESLELVRNMDSLRRLTSSKQVDKVEAGQLDRLQEYLTQLEPLVVKLESTRGPMKFTSKWSSPLSGKGSSSMFKLKGLGCEMGMATFQFGSALRAAAMGLLNACSIPTDTGDTAPAPAGTADIAQAAAAWASAATEASNLFRRAAGVFMWLADRGLPRVAQHLPSDRPVELVMSMSRAMTQVCLSEAQVVTACRAAQRGVSPALVCALHAGAWELWESAAKILRDNAGDLGNVSDRLKRFLAASSAIARARALRWLATDLTRNKQQAGQAEAACMVSSSLLASAGMAAEVDASWRQVIARQAAATETTRQECERDRTTVLYQTISNMAPDLPRGKVLVTPIPFEPGRPAGRVSNTGSDHEQSMISTPVVSPTTATSTPLAG